MKLKRSSKSVIPYKIKEGSKIDVWVKLGKRKAKRISELTESEIESNVWYNLIIEIKQISYLKNK